VIKIQFNSLKLRESSKVWLNDFSWDFTGSRSLCIAGNDDSGKHCFGPLLSGKIPSSYTVSTGTYSLSVKPQQVHLLSFKIQSELLKQELKEDISDFMSDGIDPGHIVYSWVKNPELVRKWGLDTIMSQGLKTLSTGELRKIMLCRTLSALPDMLILDEPYDGLDSQSRLLLNVLMQEITDKGCFLLLITDKTELLPSFIENIVTLDNNRMKESSATADISLNLIDTAVKLPVEKKACIEIFSSDINYGEKPVLKDITWKVFRGDKWIITGPNGCGKTSLTQAVTGENTRGYSMDLTLFGQPKGQGESLWDIRKKIGYVSGAIQFRYSPRTSVRDVLVSGLLDPEGGHGSITPLQKKIVAEKLVFLEMDENTLLGRLSFGMQRMVLLMRALIKKPELLILDEPYQGLDRTHSRILDSIMVQLAADPHQTVLLISHESWQARPFFSHHLDFVPHESGAYTVTSRYLL